MWWLCGGGGTIVLGIMSKVFWVIKLWSNIRDGGCLWRVKKEEVKGGLVMVALCSFTVK